MQAVRCSKEGLKVSSAQPDKQRSHSEVTEAEDCGLGARDRGLHPPGSHLASTTSNPGGSGDSSLTSAVLVSHPCDALWRRGEKRAVTGRGFPGWLSKMGRAC